MNSMKITAVKLKRSGSEKATVSIKVNGVWVEIISESMDGCFDTTIDLHDWDFATFSSSQYGPTNIELAT